MTREGFREIADRVWLHETARLDVDEFSAGPGTIINAHARVFGSRVILGRECWIDESAVIGGGSAHDPGAHLTAGHWLHMGLGSHVNTARGVTVGDEIGIGIGTRVFTHGSYLSEWLGFPVTFEGVTMGSRVWLPSAQVNPGTVIGSDVVAAAGAVVMGEVPSRTLVGGAPARVLKALEPGAPTDLGRRREILDRICTEVELITGRRPSYDAGEGTIRAGDAWFDLDAQAVSGPADAFSEKLRDQLRRRGIRFRFEVHGGEYRPWEDADS